MENNFFFKKYKNKLFRSSGTNKFSKDLFSNTNENNISPRKNDFISITDHQDKVYSQSKTVEMDRLIERNKILYDDMITNIKKYEDMEKIIIKKNLILDKNLIIHDIQNLKSEYSKYNISSLQGDEYINSLIDIDIYNVKIDQINYKIKQSIQYLSNLL